MTKPSVDNDARNFAVQVAYIPDADIRKELAKVPLYERWPGDSKTPDASERLTRITSQMRQLLQVAQDQLPVTERAQSPIDGHEFVTVAVNPHAVEVTIADSPRRSTVLTRTPQEPGITRAILIEDIEGGTATRPYVIVDPASRNVPSFITRSENFGRTRKRLLS